MKSLASLFARRVLEQVMPVNEIAAVVLYDEIASGFRAKGVCDRLLLGLAGDVELRISLWRTDVLENATESNIALAEAAGADLVILALQSTRFLTNLVRQWLETWAAARHVEDAALVVLASESERVLSPITAHQLRQFAKVHSLNCFCESQTAAADHPAGSLAIPAEHSSASASPLPPIPDRPGAFSHWGLND